MASLIDAHGKGAPAGPAWDRPNGLGLTLSIVLPLAAVLIGNGLLALTGGEENADYQAVPWNPPGWLIGAIWCVIYPLWGAARWKTATKDDPRAGRSMWVAALIVWGLFYPVVTAFVDTLGSVIANGFSLALAAVALLKVRPVSGLAAWMIVPSFVWLVIANALGIQALQMAS
jgi:benzodiazapine receptor